MPRTTPWILVSVLCVPLLSAALGGPLAAAVPAAGGNDAPASDDPKPCVFRATCRDEAGRSLKGVQLRAPFVKGSQVATSDEQGRMVLTLKPPLALIESCPAILKHATPASTVWLRFTAPGRTSVERWETTISEDDIDLGEVVLRPAGSVTGRVVDKDGKPVRDAVVFVRQPVAGTEDARAALRVIASQYGISERLVLPVPVDEEGRFRIEGVLSTFVCVMAAGHGYYHGFSDPIEVTPGKPARAHDIVLERVPENAGITGHVRDRAGKGVSGVPVQYGNAEGRATFVGPYIVSGENGAFTIPVFPGQSYSVSALGSQASNVKAGTGDLVLVVNRASLEEAARSQTRSRKKEPARTCFLAATFSLGEARPVGWNASLGDYGDQDVLLDPRGSVVLAAARPGEDSLVLQRMMLGTGVLERVVCDLTLKPGMNEKTWSLPTGRLVIQGLKPLPTLIEDARTSQWSGPRYVVTWKGPDGIFWGAGKYGGASRTWRLPAVPAGQVRIVEEEKGETKRVLAEVEVKAGEEKVVKIW